MASFTNRSRYYVAVPNGPRAKVKFKLKREFPFSALAEAQAYVNELKADGLEPVLGQYEDSIEVRIRTRGFREIHFTATSYQKAEDTAMKIEEERSRGLFIDYTKSMNVTLAQLIRKYIIEECPTHKGCEIETYKLNALLVDSGDDAVTWAEQHSDADPADCPRQPTGRLMRDPMVNLEWLHKPFALVLPTDIEDFIRDRMQSVAPATVDRELDHLSSVINATSQSTSARSLAAPSQC